MQTCPENHPTMTQGNSFSTGDKCGFVKKDHYFESFFVA